MYQSVVCVLFFYVEFLLNKFIKCFRKIDDKMYNRTI